MIKKIRKVSKDDLDYLLAWRNHPDIRNFMFTQHEIKREEHLNWFKVSSEDPKKHLLIYEEDFEPRGFINFTEILESRVVDWGFYLSPKAPRGSGLRLGTTVLKFAFTDLGFYKVCGQAIDYNERSKRFHLKLGFKEEDVLKDNYFDGKDYHDVYRFGLIRTSWKVK